MRQTPNEMKRVGEVAFNEPVSKTMVSHCLADNYKVVCRKNVIEVKSVVKTHFGEMRFVKLAAMALFLMEIDLLFVNSLNLFADHFSLLLSDSPGY